LLNPGPESLNPRLLVECLDRTDVFLMTPHAPLEGERRRRGKQDRRSAEIGLVIRGTLEQTIMVELLPRSQIDIYVQVHWLACFLELVVLQGDGSQAAELNLVRRVHSIRDSLAGSSGRWRNTMCSH